MVSASSVEFHHKLRTFTEETSLTVKVNKQKGDEMFQGLLTHDPTAAEVPRISRLEREGCEEKVPIVQPVHNLWHFLNQKYAVSVHRISSENPNSLSGDPLLDVVKNRSPNGVMGVRRFQARFCEA